MTNQLSSLKRQYEVLENEEIQLQVSQDSKANLRTVEEIHREVWSLVSPLLNLN